MTDGPRRHRLVTLTLVSLFAGDRVYMRDHSSVAYDNGSGVDRLADGLGMETRLVRPLHRGRRPDAAPLQHARPSGMLPSQGQRYPFVSSPSTFADVRPDCNLTFYVAAYIKAAAALCVVCLLTDIAATILTGLGLRTQDHRDKHKYYRFAVFCMGLAREYYTIASFLSSLFSSHLLITVYLTSVCIYFSGIPPNSVDHISHMFCSRTESR